MARSRLLGPLLRIALGAMGLFVLGCSPPGESGGESNGTPEARTELTTGEAARRAGKHADAAAAFRRAIEIDPDFVEAHVRFIETTRYVERSDAAAADRKLQALYD